MVSVIWGCSRSKPDAIPFAVAAYIISAYWFTASTSFANPAVTVARSLSDTFAFNSKALPDHTATPKLDAERQRTVVMLYSILYERDAS
jgi:hypothetical protein